MLDFIPGSTKNGIKGMIMNKQDVNLHLNLNLSDSIFDDGIHID